MLGVEMGKVYKIIAFSVLFLVQGTASAENCQKYWDRYLQKKEESKNVGGPGTAVAMGAASFFLPVIGTLAVGGGVAATAALLNKQAEENKAEYYACLKREAKRENERQAEANRRWQEENKRRKAEQERAERERKRQEKEDAKEELDDLDL